MKARWLLITLGAALASEARAGDYAWDVRASSHAVVARRALLPGPGGVEPQAKTLAPFYGYATARVEGYDVPWAEDGVSAELSAWGAVGALGEPSGQAADAELQAAWVQHRVGALRLKAGRQVVLGPAPRYLRFDGVLAAVRVGELELEGYGGLVALPRWNRPVGYWALGDAADALEDPSLADAQGRWGSRVLGAQLRWRGGPRLWGAAGVQQQERGGQLEYRSLSADVRASPIEGVNAGARGVFDTTAEAISEARVFVDVLPMEPLPVTVEYAYQAPALLLPASSVLAAFGGAAWHELGAEATWRQGEGFKLTGRAAGQLYEQGLPGARASLRAQGAVDPKGRLRGLAEYARVAAYDNGYHHLRAGARYRATESLFASVDGALYVYDLPVRGSSRSVVAFASAEQVLSPSVRVLLSGSLASTPYAAFDAQVFGRLVFDLDGSAGEVGW